MHWTVAARNSFRLKLWVTSGVLLGVSVLLAVLFYTTTQRYQYHIELNTIADRVLMGYQAVSDHTYRKLNAVGEMVALNAVMDVEARQENERLLWEALAEVRRSLEEEQALAPRENYPAQIQTLEDIERLAETIIARSSMIREALQAGDGERAAAELSALRSDNIAGRFNSLINQALSEERRAVALTQSAVIELGVFINGVLPWGMFAVVMLGIVLALTISRRLTGSLMALERAASAYSSGDLDHRLQAMTEVEFERLAGAFNRMAEELSARRRQSQLSQELLEREVDERTRELAQAIESLELADGSRRRFLADISHELRTPLTIIRGEADMALRGEDKAAESYKEALERVRDQVIHTTRLVRDLLFVARSEEGHARIDRKPVDLGELLGGVCADFRSPAAKRRIVIEEQYAEEALVVLGDAGRLRQVFAILIDNGIRYAYEDQPIRVEARRVGSRVGVSVSNRGIGISEDDAVQAFERFYRGDAAHSQAEGTGLGLPVAKAIVDAHGGQIALSGEQGVGAVAEVWLPGQQPVSAVA